MIHDPPGPQLTQRQLEVVQLMADDYGVDQIARKLHLGPASIKTHKMVLYHRLGVHTAQGAVGAAYQHGILSPHPHVVQAAEMLRRAGSRGYWLALTRGPA